jgi:hypothetical protein
MSREYIFYTERDGCGSDLLGDGAAHSRFVALLLVILSVEETLGCTQCSWGSSWESIECARRRCDVWGGRLLSRAVLTTHDVVRRIVVAGRVIRLVLGSLFARSARRKISIY